MINFSEVAKELANAFVVDRRDDGQTFVKFRDDAPEWCDSDLMREVHQALDDRLPDDWVYETASRLADSLAEYETADDARDAMGELADGLVDVYNADRLRWLSSHLYNAFLVDEAVEELGSGDEDTFERIGLGQYLAVQQIGYAVIRAIEDRLGELDDDEEDEDSEE